jgi:hypothetical protein
MWNDAISAMPKVLKEAARQQAFFIQAHIGDRMRFTGKGSAVYPNDTNELQTVGGKLYQSFIPNKAHNIYRPDISPTSASVVYGSDLIYAKVHEEGMFIKSKGKMASFFWARYYKTKVDYWKYVALSVQKKGGVDIPKREYFGVAIKDYQDSNEPQVIFDEVLLKLKKELFKL